MPHGPGIEGDRGVPSGLGAGADPGKSAMLFNSIEFIAVFLPATLVVFYLVSWRLGGSAALSVLLVASLAFYGYWKPPFVLLLLGSIGSNFLIARAIGRATGRLRRGGLLGIGIAFNLGLLGYFKYANFFISTADHVAGLWLAARRRRPAARHLVLHLPADRLPGRRIPAGKQRREACGTTRCSSPSFRS